jgi:hypothetical protein
MIRKEVRCILIFGNNNTGKSVVAKSIIASWVKKNPNGFVAAFDPQNRFTKDIDIKDKEDLEDLPSMKNSLIVFDDYRKIHPSERQNKWLADLMDNRFEQGIDLVFICHSPKRIIEFLTYYIDTYLVFYTNYKDKDIQNKIPDADIIFEASELVKKEYREVNEGEYPIFPHCVVLPNDNEIIKVNFKDSPEYGKQITII